MARPRTATKQKKRWFTVLAPELFNNKELADLPAYSIDDLKGRVIEVSGQMLTGIARDSNKKYKLKIGEIRADKAVTFPYKYHLTEGFIQRSARRYKERFVSVLKLKTSDKKSVKVKANFFGLKRLPHSVRAALLKRAKELAQDIVGKAELAKLFEPSAIDNFGNSLKKDLAKIYPLSRVLVSKLSA